MTSPLAVEDSRSHRVKQLLTKLHLGAGKDLCMHVMAPEFWYVAQTLGTRHTSSFYPVIKQNQLTVY